MVRLLVIEVKHKRAREPIQLPDHDVPGMQVGEEPEELGLISPSTGRLLVKDALAPRRVQRLHLRRRGCLRCLLLVMCTHPFTKKAPTLHLARSEGHERYFGCNLM